jgi:hypothetical protein
MRARSLGASKQPGQFSVITGTGNHYLYRKLSLPLSKQPVQFSVITGRARARANSRVRTHSTTINPTTKHIHNTLCIYSIQRAHL